MIARRRCGDAITESHFELAPAFKTNLRDGLYMLAWLPKVCRPDLVR